MLYYLAVDSGSTGSTGSNEPIDLALFIQKYYVIILKRVNFKPDRIKHYTYESVEI